MESKIRIGWENILASMTLSSNVAAQTNFPLSNLVDETKGVPARFTMGTETVLTIKGTQADDFTINFLMAKRHNLLSDATVRTRVFSDTAWTTEVYDSDDTEGADVIYTEVPWGEMIAGVDPWGNYYDPDSNLDTVYTLPFETIVGKSIQVDITVPNPVNGMVKLDKLIGGFGWSPDEQFESGSVFQVQEPQTQHRLTRAGGLFTARRPARRRLSINFSNMPDDYRDVLMSILERRGMWRDLYIIANPNDTGYSKYLSSSVFRREDDVSAEILTPDLNNMSQSFVEN